MALLMGGHSVVTFLITTFALLSPFVPGFQKERDQRVRRMNRQPRMSRLNAIRAGTVGQVCNQKLVRLDFLQDSPGDLLPHARYRPQSPR
jgi:hypothetical protein